MKILLDSNIVIDSLAMRTPHNKNSDAIFTLIINKDITGYINTSSVTDIYYVIRKTFNDTDSRQKIRELLKLLEAIEVTKGDCYAALDSLIPDFEDAVVAVCADKVNIDYIVTRDEEFLKIPNAISPGDFLKKFDT